MRKNYQRRQVRARAAADAVVVPEEATIALGEVAESVKEGLLALAVGAGMQVLAAMMAESVTGLCGPKGRHDPDRRAVRHGTEAGSVTLGGRRVPVRRPRVRAVDGSGELPVPAYGVFAGTEVLGRRQDAVDLADRGQVIHGPGQRLRVAPADQDPGAGGEELGVTGADAGATSRPPGRPDCHHRSRRRP